MPSPPLCHFCGLYLQVSARGRPKLYCDDGCRRDAWEKRQLDALYPLPWQQKALCAGWRPPGRSS